MNHYPEKAEDAASKAIYDIVCCGHTHIQETKEIGTTLLINPGKVMSEKLFENSEEGVCYAIYDTFTGKVELFRLD